LDYILSDCRYIAPWLLPVYIYLKQKRNFRGVTCLAKGSKVRTRRTSDQLDGYFVQFGYHFADKRRILLLIPVNCDKRRIIIEPDRPGRTCIYSTEQFIQGPGIGLSLIEGNTTAR